ncbi:P-loop NTPase fold protein [Pseudomonas luteola]
MSVSEPRKEFSNSIQIRAKELSLDDEDWPCSEDRLERHREIENISPVLLNAQAPLVFAVDAPWGGGKTTFFRLWQKYLKKDGKESLYLNAWENDFAEDPLLPMLSTLDKWLGREEKDSACKRAWEKAKTYAPGIVKATAVAATKAATFGVLDLEKEYEKLAAEVTGGAVDSLIDSFNVKQKSLEKFKEQLGLALEALPENQKNLIVFVDELDRCKPTYAIDVLERIKHLFDVERLVFVLAINRDQLSKSFQGVYGPSFDGLNYLKRFIDLDYQLNVPKIDSYVNAKVKHEEFVKLLQGRPSDARDYDFGGLIIGDLAKRFQYTPRDIDQFITRLSLVLRSIPTNHYLDTPILLALMFLRQGNPELYYRYVNNPMCANEVIEFLLDSSVEAAKMAHHLAVVAGQLISVNNDPYNNSRENTEALLAPWRRRFEGLEPRNEMRDRIEVIIELSIKSSIRRRELHRLAFDRIELVNTIDINM